MDSAGAAYLTGSTASADFPTRNALQASRGGGIWDAFVARLVPNRAALAFSTHLGGSGDDLADDRSGDLAIDPMGNVYVAAADALDWTIAGPR